MDSDAEDPGPDRPEKAATTRIRLPHLTLVVVEGIAAGASITINRGKVTLGAAPGCDIPVLLLGEGGTGKNLTARAIHEASDRKAGPLVTFDCSSATPEALAGLFGTGGKPVATSASGGTLFLDEVGDLPPEQQTEL